MSLTGNLEDPHTSPTWVMLENGSSVITRYKVLLADTMRYEGVTS